MATESTEPVRGDIWLVRFGASEPGEPGKNRPAVIVSIDGLKNGTERDLFAVVPISSTASESAVRPRIAPADSGLSRPSVAMPAAIRAVSRRRLLRHIGTAPAHTMQALEHALVLTLGLDR